MSTLVDWRYSLAKEQLLRDLTVGTIPLDKDEMGPKDVYNLPDRPEFRKYRYENFRTNLNTLRKAIIQKQASAISDSAALARDLQKYPTRAYNHRGEPRWEGSAAQESLIYDVGTAAKEGKRLTVEEIYYERDEYQDFLRRTIQKHIYQEEDAIKFQVYVEFRSEEDKKKKKKKRGETSETEN